MSRHHVALGAVVFTVAGALAWFLSQPGPMRASAPPAKKIAAKKAKGIDVAALLQKEIDFAGFDDPKTMLIEALDQLSNEYKIVFSVDEPSFKVEGLFDPKKTPVVQMDPIPKRKAPAHIVLRMILDRMPQGDGVVWLIKHNQVVITTIKAARAELKMPDEMPFILVHERFKGQKLSDALDKLAEVTETNILLDGRVKAKLATEVTATFRNVPLDTAVSLLCDMADLAVVRKQNVLYVTSPDNAARLTKVKRTSLWPCSALKAK